MWEFFRPLRRKIGLVALMLALVFMLAWIRSFIVVDFIHFHNFISYPIQNGALAGLSTEGHSLRVMKFDNYRETTPAPQPNSSTSVSSGTSRSEELEDDQTATVNTAATAVPTAVTTLLVPVTTATVDAVPIVEIPYWSITIPLTLLSALLLLTKPRKSPQKNISEPAPADGA